MEWRHDFHMFRETKVMFSLCKDIHTADPLVADAACYTLIKLLYQLKTSMAIFKQFQNSFTL